MMRSAAILLLLLAPPASADPFLVMTQEHRRLEIRTLSLDYRDGRVELAIALEGGELTGAGTWEDGRLTLDLEAHNVSAAPVLPWLLRSGAPPVSEGTLSGTGRLRRVPDAPVRIDADLALETGEVDWLGMTFTGPIRFEGPLELVDGARIQAAEVQVGALLWQGLHWLDLATSLTWRDKQLRLDDLRGHDFAAKWQGSGRLDTRERPFGFSLDLRADSTPGGELERVGSGDGVRGAFDALDGKIHLTGVLAEPEKLRGAGEFRIRGGHLKGTAILPSVWNALAGRVPLIRLPQLPARTQEPNPVEDVRATFLIENGAFHSEDVSASTGHYTATGRGRIRLDGSMAMKGEVTLTSAGLEHAGKLTGVRVGNVTGLAPVPIEISGTVREPVAEARVSHLPFSVVRALFRYALKP